MGVINRGDIFAGDSSDVWEIGFPVTAEGVRPVELAELDSNFSCRLSVKGATPAIERAVTVKNEANTRFLAFLTAAETTALGAGDWDIEITLVNLTLSVPLTRTVRRSQRIWE